MWSRTQLVSCQRFGWQSVGDAHVAPMNEEVKGSAYFDSSTRPDSLCEHSHASQVPPRKCRRVPREGEGLCRRSLYCAETRRAASFFQIIQAQKSPPRKKCPAGPGHRETLLSGAGEEEEEEEEESLFKAEAVNEEDSERDRATQV